MPAVESRYAEALLSAMPSVETADSAEAVLTGFSDIFTSHEELRMFLLNPVISKDIKKDTLQKLLSDDAAMLVKNFFFLLAEKERLEILPSISMEYRLLKNKWRNNLLIEVYSAKALDEDQLTKICEKYKNQYGASTAEVYNYIDNALLGGIRIKIGDTYIDDTLLGRLKGLLSFIEA